MDAVKVVEMGRVTQETKGGSGSNEVGQTNSL
jgi:hypothetical protein